MNNKKINNNNIFDDFPFVKGNGLLIITRYDVFQLLCNNFFDKSVK